MRTLKTVVSFTVIFLMLAACGSAPQETTPPPETPESSAVPVPVTTEPQLTTVPVETETALIETTEPSVEATIPSEYTLSYFTFETSGVLPYFDYYVAPAGTDNWYPVHIEIFDESNQCYHQRNPDSQIEDLVCLRRAFVAYDGPATAQWILRAEYHPTEQSLSAVDGWANPYYYQWDTVFELVNNETILYLGSKLDYVHGSGNTYGDSIIPITKPMEFCENCPESWLEPVG